MCISNIRAQNIALSKLVELSEELKILRCGSVDRAVQDWSQARAGPNAIALQNRIFSSPFESGLRPF